MNLLRVVLETRILAPTYSEEDFYSFVIVLFALVTSNYEVLPYSLFMPNYV